MRQFVFAVCVLLMFGCDSSDKPEFADGEQTKIFEGEFIALETTSQHGFLLVQGGTIRIELAESKGTNSVTGESIENPTLLVSIGRPVIVVGGEEGEGERLDCSVTFVTFLAPTEAFTVFLNDIDYCLVVDSNATLPDEAKALIGYIISATAAFA